jgi:hypothetical protein
MQSLLAVAADAVLIGGSALAFWVIRYDVPIDDGPQVALSADADFLGTPEHAQAFAQAIGCEARKVPGRAISSLLGMVVRRIGERELTLVDVVRRVVGLDAQNVHANAIEMALPGRPESFKVMHPVDCLISRLENLRQLREKQNQVGRWHAQIAVRVVRRYFEDLLQNEANEKTAIGQATRVLKAALSSAGRQAFAKWGVDALESIPMDAFGNESFKKQQYARMRKRILESRK